MYNKMKTGALAFVCAALVLCAGCSAAENSSSAEATPSPTAAPTATAEPTATSVPELKVVGEKSDSKDTFCVTLENGTKQEITAVSVKTGSEEKFPESMILPTSHTPPFPRRKRSIPKKRSAPQRKRKTVKFPYRPKKSPHLRQRSLRKSPPTKNRRMKSPLMRSLPTRNRAMKNPLPRKPRITAGRKAA